MSPIASSDFDGLFECGGLAALELRCHLPGFDELLLQRARPIENVLDELGGNSHRVPESLRQIEHETVGGLRRCRECVFGALALLLGNCLARCDPLLLDGNSALPVGEAGERKRDDKAGGKAAGEDVAPSRRPAPARGDKCLGLRGRLRRAARARGDPALGLLQSRRAKQKPARVAGESPPPRRFAEFRVLPDPADVGPQRLGKLIGARLEACRVIKENEFSRCSASGIAPSSTRRQTIGAKRLLSEAACATSLSATSDATASGESTNTTVSAWPISASMRFHQSSKA